MSGLAELYRPQIAADDFDSGVAWRHVDWWIVASTVLISALGALMVYSATRRRLGAGTDDASFLQKQALFVVLGLGMMAFTAAVDYRGLRRFAPLVYGLTTFLLFALLTPLGSIRKGAQSWFTLPGGFQLQPSEFAKITLIVMLASRCGIRRSDEATPVMGPRQLVQVLLVTAAPLTLVMLQPDLGTGLVLGAITLAILAVTGLKGRYLLLLAAMTVLAGALVLNGGVLKSYQRDRITVFVDPATNTSGAAFNLNQSKIAIGSGGVTGRGLFEGTQTKLRYVPEQHTDFIFSVVGEELGLLGSASLLGLFGIIMWRTLRIAGQANEPAGTFICVGVIGMLCFQIFENVGMTMGIMPVTGIPLPFMSYGGSSMLACFAGAGLVINVGMRRYS